MDVTKVITVSAGTNNFKCQECENEVLLEEDREYVVGDVTECEMCGTEYEIIEISDDGALELEMLLEEK